MNDSGFEEDQVQLLADLTSQALLHQPAPAGGDALESLERLVAAAAASSEVPPSSAAYLYGFTLCIGETLRYLTEQERLPADHPVVQGICHHMLSEYSRLVRQVCATGKTAASEDAGAARDDHGDHGAPAGGDDGGSDDDLPGDVRRGEDRRREWLDDSAGSAEVVGGVVAPRSASLASPDCETRPEDGPKTLEAARDV